MAKTLSFTDTSTQTVKIGDTTTSFTLICGNDNVATDLTGVTSITAKLGNSSGYLKSETIDPTKLTDPTTGQVTVTFTADLMTSLPAGNYYIEVWVVDSNGTSIYPSDGMVGFTINDNIQSTNGTTITTITFDDFVAAMNKAANTMVAAGIQDKSINIDKLSQALQDSFVPTVEEVPITGQSSGYISIQTGHNVASDNVYYSDSIPVTPGDAYIANGTTFYDGRTVILEDVNANVVGYFPESLTDAESDSKQIFMFVVPQGAVKMYINTKVGAERHLYKVKDFSRIDQATSDFVSTIVNGKQAKYQPVELTKCTSDGYWGYQDGYYYPDTSGSTSTVGYNQLSVKPFETYRINGDAYFAANLYNMYDFKGQLIESFPNTNLNTQFYDQTFTVPCNGAFLKVNQYKAGPDVTLEKVVEWNDKSPITDKKWVAIGDSWTAASTLGVGVDNYTNYVADRLGVTMVNASVGGTGYVAQNGSDGDQFYNRQIPADGDAYTILGSFNDLFVDGFKFGDVGDTDKLTLWGGMKATLDHIWSIKDNAVVGIISPGPWGIFNPQDENNWGQLNIKASEYGEQYVSTMEKFANYYSLPFFDLYHQSGLRPWDSNFIAKYYHGTNDTDTTHPNTNGHKIFAPKIANFVNELL
ncbi:SGNH/GDSL hydrolase family protein [Lactiplantibacillus plantarum]|uniref:SGNH/GDSL hydrolase family protein n=1 Tax=Lactiplantibacillus plantarum TaxID=1590 RepID=UPI001E3B00C2|nr:SGNH/GDSL hydrolase family protein [Lactiplantibacillus plantarum]MCC6111963.1 SGNH/GDSL hydrolase family protein [Lactiplantibacillus plantarum]MCW6128590.1 SGNH/GDSL hydrolase family protein [Lactiplantibacillus plantarum]